ncbi:MAG: pimelyl-[acyl-carrier protein] methyl ester esterase [Gammaproteobacteria bacterium]|nr:pimelyl-[acyl-carrier protein] methyl ester esterase [Gammaproteobacteria bacterium]
MLHNDRQTLCLIHGWGFDSRVWEGLVTQLPAHWQIITLDLPGYGANVKLDPPAGINLVAEMLIPFIPCNAVLVGWSLGGMVAIKIASLLGVDIDTLILLASTPCFVKKSGWPHGMEPELIKKMADQLSGDSHKVLQEFSVLAAKGDDIPRQTIRDLRTSAAYGNTSTKTLVSGLDILRDADLRSDMSELKCRVVMLLGERDHLIAKTTGPATQILCPHTQLAYITTAGHAPFISKVKPTADMIIKYIQTHDHEQVR